MSAEFLQTAAAVSEGRRSAQGGRPEEGRPAHRRRSALPLSAPLRRSQPAAAHRRRSSPARRSPSAAKCCTPACSRRGAPGFRLFTALVQDASGQIQAVWPNQAFLKDVIRPHQHIVLYGKAEYWGSRGLQITDPEFEIIAATTDGDGATTTVDACTPAASSRSTSGPAASRRTCSAGSSGRRSSSCRRELFDPVPADIRAREALAGAPRRAAARALSRRAARRSTRSTRFETPAQRRLIFEDFFVFQAGLALRRQQNAQVRKALVCRRRRSSPRRRRARCCRSS